MDLPPPVVTPLQGWVIVIVLTQGGATLCPGLTCYAPSGQKRRMALRGNKRHWILLCSCVIIRRDEVESSKKKKRMGLQLSNWSRGLRFGMLTRLDEAETRKHGTRPDLTWSTQ